jgi:hypothetical protein
MTVNTNDGDLDMMYCNGIGECDFTRGTCKCPLGYGFDPIRGDCGRLVVNSSAWTGVETCPGNVDQVRRHACARPALSHALPRFD